VAHKMPTTHVGCYRPAVLDGGSNPPISTTNETARQLAGRFCLSSISYRTRPVVASFLLYHSSLGRHGEVWPAAS
jgi:hypothetical protein